MMHRAIFAALLILSTAACDKVSGIGKKPEAGTRGMPDFGGVEIVDVTADGVGPTRNAALLDALNQAVRQTNGTPIIGMTENINGSLALPGVAAGDFGITLDNVVALTRGAVKSYEIVREREKGASWRITVKAKVAKFKDPAANGLPKVAIAAPRTGSSTYSVGDETLSSQVAADAVRNAVAQAISGSNRFFVIDREYDAELDAETARITDANANPTELVKLGQRLTADILILPEIQRLDYRKSSRTLRYSGRELRSYAGGADIAFKVLNVATGQLILSKTYSVQFPATPPSVTGAQVVDGSAVQGLLGDLANRFTREFVQTNFPIAIAKMEGSAVTLTQGGAYVQPGEIFEVVRLGEEVRDPQTGQVLGRSEQSIGRVSIGRVYDSFSTGTFQGRFDPARFKPGLLELRKTEVAPVASAPLQSEPVVADPRPAQAVAATPNRAAPRPAANRSAAMDDFSGDFDF